MAFVLCEAVGLAAAIWPLSWLGLFGDDPAMLATGVTYLRHAGPAYGFFGLGLALYFASQGAGSLGWALFAGLLRMVIAVGGGWAAWIVTRDLGTVFAVLSVALVVYGVVLLAAVRSGVWFRRTGEARQTIMDRGSPISRPARQQVADLGQQNIRR